MYRSCSLKSTSRITRHFNLICCIGTPLLQPIKHIRHRLTCFPKNLPKIHQKHLQYAYFPPTAVVHAREKIAASPEDPVLWTPAPMRRAPLKGRPQRGERQRALPSGLPLGLCPRPRDAAHLCLACGRDGGLGASETVYAVLTGLPKGRAVRSGRLLSLWMV